jgi:hypothetical protein
MKNKFFRLVVMTLVLAMLLPMVLPVSAADSDIGISPASSSYISAVWASATGSNGKITVEFDITGTSRMTSLGATKVQIKDSSGTTVKTFYSSTTSGMIGYNKSYYYSTVTYNGATSGKKYYAVVSFKAANSSGSDTDTYVTAYTTA